MSTVSDFGVMLGKMLLPRHRFTVTVCTVGGTDENGEELYEPVVFEGSYAEAVEFFNDEENADYVERMVNSMPDGYILIENDSYSRSVYGVYDIFDAIAEMR